ncbi:MAG: type II toxin-antitoxin system RelB/DinJ family antitoxin [Lachnospiraceae bacterium]|nr:type II toxin-antitoxin system RelB/DinJ family antitoxin [Lachnospiraceae bacterium]
MAKTETLHIRVNETVKENAEETLELLGISISEAVNMFLCQVNLTGGLPFEVKLPAPERVTVRTKEELYRKLEEAEADVREGRVRPANEVFDRLRAQI